MKESERLLHVKERVAELVCNEYGSWKNLVHSFDMGLRNFTGFEDNIKVKQVQIHACVGSEFLLQSSILFVPRKTMYSCMGWRVEGNMLVKLICCHKI